MTRASIQTNELEKLNFLIGAWHTEGTTIQSDTEAAKVIQGTDRYDWISGGCFILHRVEVSIGSDHTEVVEIIGYDETRQRYFMTSYDNTGSVVTMDATLNENGVLELGNNEMRATLYRQHDRNLKARWELFNKTWQPWMDIELKR